MKIMDTKQIGGIMPQQAFSLISLVVIFGIMYFMLIRPQKKKDKEIQNMRSSLTIGDEVITIGGIHGKIVKVNDEIIVLEMSHAKQRIEFSKWAVGSIAKKGKESKSEAKPKITDESSDESTDDDDNNNEK